MTAAETSVLSQQTASVLSQQCPRLLLAAAGGHGSTMCQKYLVFVADFFNNSPQGYAHWNRIAILDLGWHRFEKLPHGCRDMAISMCLAPSMFLRHRESVVETGQMSSVETRQMSQQHSSVLSQQ